MHPHEETALQLALSQGGVPHAATTPASQPYQHQQQHEDQQHQQNEQHHAHHAFVDTNSTTPPQQQQRVAHDDNAAASHGTLVPLAMPSSPMLHAQHQPPPHHHLHRLYGGSHAHAARLTMLSEAGGGVGSSATAVSEMSAAAIAASVHSYFQADAALGGMSMSVGHFDDMKLDAPSKTRKRKSGTNASIDLQTKIRLIEMAEEFQYDPKTTSRKHDGAASPGHSSSGSTLQQHSSSSSSKDAMSGIRLAAQFGLNKSTVSRILKRKEEFKKAYYKDNISGCSKHINKKSKFEKLNRLVENWFDVTREKKIAVSDTLIRDVGKKFAEELGIEDFRGSNGWVRSLRNRKEQQARKMSHEAMERERLKKDAEAVERVRAMFPAGMKDMASFFKDLTIYLDKDGGGLNGSTSDGLATPATPATPAAPGGGAYSMALEAPGADGEDVDKGAEEFLKKKMIESLRLWSQELLELELAKMKQRLKARVAPPPLPLHQQQHQQQLTPAQLQQPQLQQQQQQQQQHHQTAVI